MQGFILESRYRMVQMQYLVKPQIKESVILLCGKTQYKENTPMILFVFRLSACMILINAA